MATLDLKPISDETIKEMGYTSDHLWFVKIQSTVYGPFETESLKHYSAENSQLFTEAVACQVDSQQWQPFFGIAHFQRRVQPTDQTFAEGPFWLLLDGQKAGPLSKQDLEKKLEMGVVARTDLFSTDDGQTWQKIYQIASLDRRNLTVDSLPHSPNETSFQKAKQEVVENMESHQGQSQQDGLASLAYLGQKKDKLIVLNLDEITLKAIQETDVSRSLKWAIPAMVGCFLLVAASAWYFISPRADAPLADAQEEVSEKVLKREVILPKTEFSATPSPSPTPRQDIPARRPASIAPVLHQFRSPLTRSPEIHESDFPTHVETHGADRAPSNEPEDADSFNQPVEPEPVQEDPSLVNANDDQALDREISREPASQDPAQNQPVMEEASDF